MDSILHQQTFSQQPLLITYSTCNLDNQGKKSSNRLSSSIFKKRVSEEELERVMYYQVPLTHQGESQIIEVWRRYIAQRTSEEGSRGQFEAMEKMIQCYWQQQEEQSIIKGNRYYCEVWLKYASKVKRPEDVYEMMLDSGVGKGFAKTYSKIADYYENSLLDYRKADKVYRIGQSRLKEISLARDNCSQIDSEIATLDSLYVRFTDRMLKRSEIETLNELQKAKKDCINIRKGTQLMKIVQEHEEIYCNKRKSFTRNQVILGGIPIYVDEQFRDQVIPQGTQKVEEFYDMLKEIDKYEPFSLKYLQESKDVRLSHIKAKASKLQNIQEPSKENYFVQALQQQRKAMETEKITKQDSWLDRQPFMKLDYNQPLLLENSLQAPKKSIPPPDTFAMVTPDPSPIEPKQFQISSISKTPESLNFHLNDSGSCSSTISLFGRDDSSIQPMNVPITCTTSRKSQQNLSQSNQAPRRVVITAGKAQPVVNMSIIKEEEVQTSQDLSISLSSSSVNGV